MVEARESVALVGVLLRRNQRSIEHRVELHRMPWLVPTQSAATAHAELGGVQTRGCLRAPRPMMAAWGSATGGSSLGPVAGGSSLGPSTGRPSSRGSAVGGPPLSCRSRITNALGLCLSSTIGVGAVVVVVTTARIASVACVIAVGSSSRGSNRSHHFFAPRGLTMFASHQARGSARAKYVRSCARGWPGRV